MPEATDDVLTRLSEGGALELFRIDGLRYTPDSLYLGSVGVSNLHPTFHAGVSGELSPDSRFVLKKHQRPGHATKVFVVFDSSTRHPITPSRKISSLAGFPPSKKARRRSGSTG